MGALQHVGPLLLEPLLKERIWGVHELPAPYGAQRLTEAIGEVWLTAEECAVTQGSLAGSTLRECVRRQPERFGDFDGGGFPLLLKVLLPREKLSVQVHPDDAEARLLGEPRGKSECWYVLSADPGAKIAVGLRAGTTLEQVRAAIADGTMEERMEWLTVKAGDMVYVDAGTVHAMGPGVVVLETQEYSDITYRMFDYGRPRELHVEQGIAVTKLKTAAGLVPPQPHNGFVRLVESAWFAVDRFSDLDTSPRPLNDAGALQIVFARTAGCTLQNAAGEPFDLPAGKAVLLPAEGEAYTIASKGDGGEVIRVLQPRG